MVVTWVGFFTRKGPSGLGDSATFCPTRGKVYSARFLSWEGLFEVSSENYFAESLAKASPFTGAAAQKGLPFVCVWTLFLGPHSLNFNSAAGFFDLLRQQDMAARILFEACSNFGRVFHRRKLFFRSGVFIGNIEP